MSPHTKTTIKLDMVVHTHNLSLRKYRKDHNFHDRLRYTARPCLKEASEPTIKYNLRLNHYHTTLLFCHTDRDYNDLNDSLVSFSSIQYHSHYAHTGLLLTCVTFLYSILLFLQLRHNYLCGIGIALRKYREELWE